MSDAPTYQIDTLPEGAVIEAVDPDGCGYHVLLPDGERWAVRIEDDASAAGFRVVKTITPADSKIEIGVGNPEAYPVPGEITYMEIK